MERWTHTAWTPPSLPDSIVLLGGANTATRLTAEIVPGVNQKIVPGGQSKASCSKCFAGGQTFPLEHSGRSACAIPDRATIVLVGGIDVPTIHHNYVTRWDSSLVFDRMIKVSGGIRPNIYNHHCHK